MQQLMQSKAKSNMQEVTMATKPRVYLSTRHTVFTVENNKITISYSQRRVGGAKQPTAMLCRANHEADNSNSVHALTTVLLTNNTIQVNFA